MNLKVFVLTDLDLFLFPTGVKLAKEENLHRLSVHYLPPVELNFQYPSDYPSCSAPSFTLSCKWLSVNQVKIITNYTINAMFIFVRNRLMPVI